MKEASTRSIQLKRENDHENKWQGTDSRKILAQSRWKSGPNILPWFFFNFNYPLISNFKYLGFILEFLFVLFLYLPVLGQIL